MTAKEALRRDNINDSISMLKITKKLVETNFQIIKEKLIEVDAIDDEAKLMSNSVREINRLIKNLEAKTW